MSLTHATRSHLLAHLLFVFLIERSSYELKEPHRVRGSAKRCYLDVPQHHKILSTLFLTAGIDRKRHRVYPMGPSLSQIENLRALLVCKNSGTKHPYHKGKHKCCPTMRPARRKNHAFMLVVLITRRGPYSRRTVLFTPTAACSCAKSCPKGPDKR